ncbi:MAG: transposase [Dehalococcoidia bacterium]
MLHKSLPKFGDGSYAHFVTTRTYGSRPYFNNEAFSQILLEELKFYKDKYLFVMIGYVIMPDHLHLLLWWDKEEKPGLSVSKIMQGIKGVTARRVIDLMLSSRLEHPLQPTRRKQVLQSAHNDKRGQNLPYDHQSADTKSHRHDLKYRLWQPGFYDFNVYSEEKLLEKLNYIHGNPVKAGLVVSPRDYKWSSHREYFEGETRLSSKF